MPLLGRWTLWQAGSDCHIGGPPFPYRRVTESDSSKVETTSFKQIATTGESIARAPSPPAFEVAAPESQLPAEVCALEVRCDRQAPAVVRVALGRIAGIEVVLADATLLASELVTNAVVHSAVSPGDVLGVTVGVGGDGLSISVHRPGPSSPVADPLASEAGLQPGGWTLRVVEQLASRWGRDRREGYRVWAELPVPSR